jgi:hypothetical protein
VRACLRLGGARCRCACTCGVLWPGQRRHCGSPVGAPRASQLSAARSLALLAALQGELGESVRTEMLNGGVIAPLVTVLRSHKRARSRQGERGSEADSDEAEDRVLVGAVVAIARLLAKTHHARLLDAGAPPLGPPSVYTEATQPVGSRGWPSDTCPHPHAQPTANLSPPCDAHILMCAAF